jgi:hypothetical protein
MVINNNITVSEIEEPQLACSIEDENAQPSESKHSLPRFTESAQPIKKKLINDPHQMQTRLMDHHHEKPDRVPMVRFQDAPENFRGDDEFKDCYQSQSEGHRLIQHIEESLESVNQYIKLSDTSQSSLQNTLQLNL